MFNVIYCPFSYIWWFEISMVLVNFLVMHFLREHIPASSRYECWVGGARIIDILTQGVSISVLEWCNIETEVETEVEPRFLLHHSNTSTRHLCLEDDGIVLSNCFRKWCLTGLEKDLAAVKMPCTTAYKAQLKQHFYWWNMLVSTRIASV